jgi:hypothetical protein
MPHDSCIQPRLPPTSFTTLFVLEPLVDIVLEGGKDQWTYFWRGAIRRQYFRPLM